MRRRLLALPLSLLLIAAAAGPLWAVKEPERSSPVAQKAVRHPALEFTDLYRPPDGLPAAAAARAQQDLAALGVAPGDGFLDLRSGRWGTLIATQPLLPGRGVGNTLGWADLGIPAPRDRQGLERAAWDAFVAYLESHRDQLGVDPAELQSPGRVTVHDGGDLVQIYAQRRIGGLPVRDAFLTAVVRHGNLILFGAHRWGEVDPELLGGPRISAAAAAAVVADHLAGAAAFTTFWGPSERLIVPLSAGPLDGVAPGRGYDHRQVWAVRPQIPGELGRWEALVDAASGELLAFEDTNHYANERTVVGGAYPVSNDGAVPDGIEQTSPMPYANITGTSGSGFSDGGGNVLGFPTGTITTTLNGQFIRITDSCGAISESTAGDVLDLGSGPGTDCAVPPGASAGNTHSARTGFYELNRIKEMARGQLPANTWLQGQLTAQTNLCCTCNAFWTGSVVQFYKKTATCSNTGELAGVIDHEFGHGLDANGATPGISNPGEGIPDVYAALRLGTSCIGRNFRATQCTGYGDPCLNCTGIRDIDWANRQSMMPHNLVWVAGNPQCGSSHCRSTVYSEAIWDLWRRDLAGPPYNLDVTTAWEVTNRLTFIGAGLVGSWWQGSGASGNGCNAGSGYLSYLATDDDDGDLTNGTPHMGAIFAAYNRHGIACPTPTVQDSGCAGTPTTAPTVGGQSLDLGAKLTWSAVPGAARYKVFRTEGVFGCDFGKTLVGETTGLQFTDGSLKNGREYYYVVAGFTSDDTCMGPASGCTTVVPHDPVIWVDLNGLGDYTDIQSAVDAAQPGDEIRVVMGVYTTPSGNVVSWVNKDLTIQGGYKEVAGALDPLTYETVIDGGGVPFRSGVYTSGLTAASRISGFTFTGGQNGHLNSGAGIHNEQSDVVISHNVFHTNSANWGAGVASWNDSDVTITHSYFHHNNAYYGAAIHNGSGSEARIVNSVFYANSAVYGGAIRNVSSNSTTVNCSFASNIATFGKTMDNRFSSPVVVNSILWSGNGFGEITDNDGQVTTVTYSDVQGGWPGTGNINADPLYVNVAAGDLRLQLGSPCIDAGTAQGAPPDDIVGTPRPQGLRFDMGAYERRKKIIAVEPL